MDRVDDPQLCLITPHNSFIFVPNDSSTILTLQTSYREMPARHLLEMVDENEIDRSAASCTDDGYGLRGKFLRNGYTESRGDLCDQLHDRRCTLLGQPIYRNES